MQDNKPGKKNRTDHLWYKDAVIYELHVKAFMDTDKDGKGDFKGLTSKLAYLKDLGITAIWLLPFYPSPLKDDGYDIADYTSIHSDYGSFTDFRVFLRTAHNLGLKVITELVLNHTSNQHPWFERARKSKPGSSWRNFYVWSDTPDKYSEARIIFKDFETSNWTWDPVGKAYYWHRFYSHQPDLNYDNPHVQKAMLKVIDFWFNLGVDGLRLDAVPYLYEREGTNCENLPETFEFLRKLRGHVDSKFKDRMLLGEANQWPEDTVQYFGDGDMCHMAFHFPLMPRLFMSVRMEDRFPIIDILDQTPLVPENCQWALFLRNHDELTLEMVTDEERDYMYRAYAQEINMRLNLGIRRRLAPLVGNNRRRIELLNGLLLSLPGTPVIYYGDEIGMGDNIFLGDRNGVRTPMHWISNRNAGFSESNPQRLYLPVIIDPEYHYEAINVDAQQNNPHSLLWWMKRIIALRKHHKAFGHGRIEFLHPVNNKVLVFMRTYEEDKILVVANLSRFVQGVEIDLSKYEGLMPVEMFGLTKFPIIGKQLYFMSLGPHTFYWFSIETPVREGMELGGVVPEIIVEGSWENVFENSHFVEKVLPSYLLKIRWFGAKNRLIKTIELFDILFFPDIERSAAIVLLEIEYVEGEPEIYVMPLIFTDDETVSKHLHESHLSPIVSLKFAWSDDKGYVYDAFADEEFCSSLLVFLASAGRLRGKKGDIYATPVRSIKHLTKTAKELTPFVMKADQSNTSIVYGNQLILKFFRKVEYGVNPDLEIGRILTRKSFKHSPSVAGAIEYFVGHEPMTMGILQDYVENEGDTWQYTVHNLGLFFERVLTENPGISSVPWINFLSEIENVPEDIDLIGTYAESARKLGQRTAEFHILLTSVTDDVNFKPDPFTKLYLRSLYQSMRSLTIRCFHSLRNYIPQIENDIKEIAAEIVASEQSIIKRFHLLAGRKIKSIRIRCHGDYHLGQVLFTGKDFVITDFEGETARPLGERRIKHSALKDVAGMIRSFNYAVFTALDKHLLIRPEDGAVLKPWAEWWYNYVSTLFITSYIETADGSLIIPDDRENFLLLLESFLMEKAIYEMNYEINNRPEKVTIPIRGIAQILRSIKKENH